MFGEKVRLWNALNMPPPSAYTWSQEHKIMACMSVFFIGNSIEGNLLQTGAFEIELNGMPVWSKLKTGRIPQGDELFGIINNQLQLSNSHLPKPPSGQFQYTPKNEQDIKTEVPKQSIDNVDNFETDSKSSSPLEEDFKEFDTEREEL